MLRQWADEGLVHGDVKRKRRYGRGLPEFRTSYAHVIEVVDPNVVSKVLPLTPQAAAAI